MSKLRLIKIGIYFLSVALGLLVAQLIFSNFHATFLGFVVAVLVFGVLQTVLSPLVEKVVKKYADFLVGGLGLITTFLSLLIASSLVKGIAIGSVGTWIGATVVIWLVTAISGALLPRLLIKEAK